MEEVTVRTSYTVSGLPAHFMRLRVIQGYAPSQSVLVGHAIDFDNADMVSLLDFSSYSATFGGIAESGTYTYVNSRDNATLSLLPNDGSASSTFTLIFSPDHVSGTYTLQETGATGTFTVH
jgi:hypothetical protein